MCATRYALRGERGFRSYRSAAISNGHSPYIEFAPANISTKTPDAVWLHRVFFVGRAALPTPTRLDNCTAKSEVPAQNNRRHCEAAGRGNPHPLRCNAPPVPGGDGKRTDCQKVNCPKGKRGHPGVRAYALAMTAVDGSRCFCREIAVVASGRRGQCHTPYGVIRDSESVPQSYGRSGQTGRL